MSSNIQVTKICSHCGKEFKAQKVTTKCCSTACSNGAYKARLRDAKIEVCNTETKRIINKPLIDLKAREFLSVRDVSILLNCSIRSVYYYIENGTIRATNLGQRITRVKRSEVDRLFEQTTPKTEPPLDISDCYTITEVQNKYNISAGALYHIIQRNAIAKTSKGKFTYVSKVIIDTLFA